MELEEAGELARRLMDENGLGDWEFRFDRARTRHGSCSHTLREITLSRHITPRASEQSVRDTILHEIAHALAGPGERHGPRWRELAVQLGATPRARTYEDVQVPHKWEGHCPRCEYVLKRHRLTERSRFGSCPRCSSTWDSRYLLQWIEVQRAG